MFDIERARTIFRKYKVKKIVWYPDYPEKKHWDKPFGQADFEAGLMDFHSQPSSLLYVHMPYCPKQCLFCNCKTIISLDYSKVENYLSWLYREIQMHVDFCRRHSLEPNITEMHLGGGSPTYIRHKDFEVYMENLRMLAGGNLNEVSIEIDPRHVKPDEMSFYHSMGINRISFGIQDFDLDVQVAVDRMQPDRIIARLLTPDIRKLFPNGVNFDIICGLPKQTRESFERTLDKVIELSPDRISLLTMNMTPETAPHQLLMPLDTIPSALDAKIFLFDAINKLTANGYERTAFDHFAKPEDDVARARKEGKMAWGSFGATAGRYQDFLGIGTSSFSRLGPSHSSQNVYELDRWQNMISQGQFPILRGHKQSLDDQIRRDITQWLRGYSSMRYAEIEARNGIDFRTYFSLELTQLEKFAEDGLVELKPDGFEMTEFGSLFADFIAETFDAYVHPVT